VVAAARRAGALGCVLSGAGPAVLAVVAGDGQDVAAAMEAALRRARIAGGARALDVDGHGAIVHAIA
jgi:homoserine kinase